MYESFFGLRDKPFNMTPDPRYLYLSDSHEEALSALLYGIQEKKGLITLTGPVGVGKTTILYSFFEQVRDRIEIAFFPGGFSSTRVGFLKELCRLFGLRTDLDSQFDLTREIEGFLRDKAKEGKNIVLLADEAQELSLEELNHFRFLNNLETPDVKFLQVILCGTGEFDEKLRDPKVLSLRQRVAIRCVINPLEACSSVAYIHHRVQVAGGSAADLFTPGAIWRIVNYARGIPRLINVVSDNALVIAFALKKLAVEEAFVREALESVEGVASAREPSGFVSRQDAEAFCLEIRAKNRGRQESRPGGEGARTAPGPEGPKPAETAARVRSSSAEGEAASAPRDSGPPDRARGRPVSGSGAEPPAAGREETGSGERGTAPPPAPMDQRETGQPLRPAPAAAAAAAARESAVGGRSGDARMTDSLPAGQARRRTLSWAVFLLVGLVTGALGSFLFLKSRGLDSALVVSPAGRELSVPEVQWPGRRPVPPGQAPTPSSPASGSPPPPPPPAAAAAAAAAASSSPLRQGLPVEQRMPAEQRVVVAAGEGIAAILRGHYGRLDPRVYAEVRRLNPGIRDMNRLEPSTPLTLPAGAAAGAGEADPGEFYTIQAVTFLTEGHADRMVAAFCGKGLQNVFVARGPIENRPAREWVCCYAGFFGTVEEALGWRDEVRKWGFPDAFVTRLRAARLEESLRPCAAAVGAGPGRGGD